MSSSEVRGHQLWPDKPCPPTRQGTQPTASACHRLDNSINTAGLGMGRGGGGDNYDEKKH